MTNLDRFQVRAKDSTYHTYAVWDKLDKKFMPDTEDTEIDNVTDWCHELEYQYQPAPPHGSIYGEPV